MLALLLDALSFLSVVLATISFGALDLFVIFLPITSPKSCGCFYLSAGLISWLLVALIYYTQYYCKEVPVLFGPVELSTLFIHLSCGFILSISGIPCLILTKPFVSSFVFQVILFNIDYGLSERLAREMAALYLSPLMAVLLNHLIYKFFYSYLSGKLENVADTMLSLRPVVPGLLVLGIFFFLSTWTPSALSGYALIISVVSLVVVYVVGYFVTKLIVGPRIKHIVFNKYPQCMSSYIDEGSNSGSMSDSVLNQEGHGTSIEYARILEVLSILQAGFAMLTFPGYSFLAVDYLHDLISSLHFTPSWGLPVGVILACVGVGLFTFRMNSAFRDQISFDPVRGASAQIAILLVCVIMRGFNLPFNFATITMATVLYCDSSIKSRLCARNIIFTLLSSIIPLALFIVSTLLSDIIAK